MARRSVGLVMRAIAACSLLLLLEGARGEAYVSERDVEVAGAASDARLEICTKSEANGDVDREKGRAELAEAIGGDNIMLTALREETKEQVGQRVLKDVMDPMTILGVSYPIVLALISLIVYFFVMWTALPCCKCCRCCKKKSPVSHGKCCKGFMCLGLLLTLGGIVGGGVATLIGYNTSNDGFDSLACGAAEVLDTTMSGSAKPYFIGLLPILETIKTMDGQLDAGSPMMVGLDAIINSTQPVEDAVLLATGVLDTLGASLSLSGNVYPQRNGEDLIHECVLCKELGAPLRDASGALADGVASALADARSSVKEAIGADKRATMQATLRNASSTLLDFKVSMRDTFANFVEDGGIFETARGLVHREVRAVVFIFFFLALLLMAFSCLSGTCCCLRERVGRQGRYHRSPHRFAGCVWCCSFLPIFLGLLVGGVLMVASFPMSAVCDVMDKLDGQLVTDIAPGIGLDLEGDNGMMLVDIVGQCLVPTAADANANIMSIVFTRDDNGTKVTTRDTFVQTVTDPINQAFETLNAAMGSDGMPTLASNADITKIRSLLGQNRLSAFYLPVASKLQADASFLPMLLDAELRAGAATSMSCPDVKPVGLSIDAAGGAIPGIESFNAKMDAKGNPATATNTSCLQTYTCGLNDTLACLGGNKLIDYKLKMAESSDIFTCHRFLTAPGGVPCDLTAMVQDNVTAVWQSDCLYKTSDGRVAVATETYPCSLEEFQAHVQEFDTILGLVFDRLDTEASLFVGSISTDLRALVNEHLVNPAMEIVDGVTCGFMSRFYSRVVDGLCFQGVYGLRMIAKSYVVLSLSMIALAILMYVVWRRAVDNVNAFHSEKLRGGT